MSGKRRMTQEDRVPIRDALDSGLSKSAVADMVGVHKRTISREVRRNSANRGYRPSQAQEMAEIRQAFRSRPRKWDRRLEQRVRRLLKKKRSPEQISKWITHEGHISCSHECSRFGHWERDTMVGGERKTAVLVCVDRKSRMVKLSKLTDLE